MVGRYSPPDFHEVEIAKMSSQDQYDYYSDTAQVRFEVN